MYCLLFRLINFEFILLFKPNFAFQEILQLLITVMVLTDLSVTLLTLLQFYWISLGAFLSVLLILPLSLLSPFPAGLNALFSKEPRRATPARVYALWNATSLSNIVSHTKLISLFSIIAFMFTASEKHLLAARTKMLFLYGTHVL